MNCQYCNNPIPPGVRNCPSCGATVQPQPQQFQQAPPYQMQQPRQPYQQPYQQQPFQPQPGQPYEQKSAALAMILSCLIPGLGQIYNGQIAKGVVIILANILLAFVTFGFSGIIILIVAIIDAGNIAGKINSGRKVDDWEFF